ncbi:hypothetical protein CLV35_1282 [Motilibacter peucedani]|uniref:Uncharacterized protein n=1 Tax=Motilibacter peucedani TaxID=598650 RepID=A0A420XRT1_9ACTN|nr:hypothetical protein CLV35_1282 [Motilibacter peucedani]
MATTSTADRCPYHPDLVPIEVEIAIRSAQSDFPVRFDVVRRCPSTEHTS